MASNRQTFWVLLLAHLLAAAGSSGSSFSSSPHSLHYFYMAMSEPSRELPEFIAVGYVDDQLFTRYDSHTQRRVPVAPWMEKVGKDDPQYWEKNTQIVRDAESGFRGNLETLQGRYNQSRGGLHTFQVMYGCDVGSDGRPRGAYFQYAYDGEDFLSFDKETLTWTACVPQAKISKDKLDMRLDVSHHYKDYLEGMCVEWLWRYLGYGNETLLRTEKPTVKVARKKGYDGQETLFCRIYGFYPKPIGMTWMKDGEDQISETYTGGVIPNSDGTYHTWLSINIDSKERDLYRCYVEHDSLPEPLKLPWKNPASNLWLTGFLIISILPGMFFFLKLRRVGCKAQSEKKPIEDFYNASSEKQQIEDPEKPTDGFLTVHSNCSRDSGHSSEIFTSEQSCKSSGSFGSDKSDTGSGNTE